MTIFKSVTNAKMNVVEIGSGDIDLIWAHGWGQSHRAFIPIIEGLGGVGRHLLLDFPGFGEAEAPPGPWGTIEYAELISEWLEQLPRRPRIWIGHSFGCRVGIRLASRPPKLVDGLFLVAAAGIRTPSSAVIRARRLGQKLLYRMLKGLALSEVARERLRDRWGSEDYRRAGALRNTFVKVVNENLTENARQITIPVQLVYGVDDTETPVVVGKMYQALIPGAQLSVLPRYGHLDILVAGRFQLQAMIKDFVQNTCK